MLCEYVVSSNVCKCINKQFNISFNICVPVCLWMRVCVCVSGVVCLICLYVVYLCVGDLLILGVFGCVMCICINTCVNCFYTI